MSKLKRGWAVNLINIVKNQTLFSHAKEILARNKERKPSIDEILIPFQLTINCGVLWMKTWTFRYKCGGSRAWTLKFGEIPRHKSLMNDRRAKMYQTWIFIIPAQLQKKTMNSVRFVCNWSIKSLYCDYHSPSRRLFPSELIQFYFIAAYTERIFFLFAGKCGVRS